MTEILATDSFVCHKKHDMQCAGHMLVKGTDNAFVQLAARMGLPLHLSGAELVFKRQPDCIEHHT